MSSFSEICEIIRIGLGKIRKEEAELEIAFKWLLFILYGFLGILVLLALIVAVSIVRSYFQGG